MDAISFPVKHSFPLVYPIYTSRELSLAMVGKGRTCRFHPGKYLGHLSLRVRKLGFLF